MEKTVINPTVLLTACVTAGIFTGIFGGCCCCAPLFSGIGASLLYTYIEKQRLLFSQVLLASGLSAIVASVPSILINLLLTEFTQKNQHLLPPEIKELYAQMQQSDQSIVTTILSITITTFILSIVGGALYSVFSGSSKPQVG